ncbi:hypothetical protein C8J57DRAFT_1478096 [Mycena rebaudengoi]|nr:hypothetical protein C8J57DRAFT_1478096 [Mycena rebaudengoi]
MITAFYLLLLALLALSLSYNAVTAILHDVAATAPVVLKRRLPVFAAVPAAVHQPRQAHRRPVASSLSLHEFLVARAKLLATAAAIARLEVCSDGLVSHPVLTPTPAPVFPRPASTTATPQVFSQYDSGLSSVVWPWPPLVPPRAPSPPHERMRTRRAPDDDDAHRPGLNASIWAPKNEHPPHRPETPAVKVPHRSTPEDDAGRPGLNASMWAPARVIRHRPQPKMVPPVSHPVAPVPRAVSSPRHLQPTVDDDDRRAGLSESMWAPSQVVSRRPAPEQVPRLPARIVPQTHATTPCAAPQPPARLDKPAEDDEDASKPGLSASIWANFLMNFQAPDVPSRPPLRNTANGGNTSARRGQRAKGRENRHRT